MTELSKQEEAALRGEWRTPKWLLGALQDLYGRFDVDAAADAGNAVASSFFTGPCLKPEPCQCGLCSRWPKGWCVFFNPPFSSASEWAMKAAAEMDRGWGQAPATAIGILPNSTETKWWHEGVRLAASYIIQTIGRIQYVPPPGIKESTNRQTTTIVVWKSLPPYMPKVPAQQLWLDVRKAMAFYGVA